MASSVNIALTLLYSRVQPERADGSCGSQAIATALSEGAAPELIFLDLRGNVMTEASSESMVSSSAVHELPMIGMSAAFLAHCCHLNCGELPSLWKRRDRRCWLRQMSDAWALQNSSAQATMHVRS